MRRLEICSRLCKSLFEFIKCLAMLSAAPLAPTRHKSDEELMLVFAASPPSDSDFVSCSLFLSCSPFQAAFEGRQRWHLSQCGALFSGPFHRQCLHALRLVSDDFMALKYERSVASSLVVTHRFHICHCKKDFHDFQCHRSQHPSRSHGCRSN